MNFWLSKFCHQEAEAGQGGDGFFTAWYWYGYAFSRTIIQGLNVDTGGTQHYTEALPLFFFFF